ncbi:MAG TPA: NAD-dependent epimerase/dehydratase family protein [bacterium]|nr:NAD-dependent epimerase/dehydratase family protein [bacterium]
MSQEHVLLLGGTRFIGAHLVQSLREAGYEPTIFHRGKSPWPWGDPPVEILGDRKEPGELVKLASLRDWAAVVDLTAFTAPDSAHAIAAFNEHTEVFVHISTGSVYHVLQDFHNPFSEEDALLFADPLPLVEEPADSPPMAYGLGKRACEEVLFNAYEESGFPVTVIRPPIVSGPLDYTLRDYAHILRVRDGGPLLVPAPSGSFRHVAVQDLARLIVQAIDLWDASIGEAFNAGGASILTLAEYYQLLCRLLDLPAPTIVPVAHGTLMEQIGPGSQPFGYDRNAIPDIVKAQSLLDWQPRRAEEYLPEVIAYFEHDYTGKQPESYTEYREKELAFARTLQPAAA